MAETLCLAGNVGVAAHGSGLLSGGMLTKARRAIEKTDGVLAK